MQSRNETGRAKAELAHEVILKLNAAYKSLNLYPPEHLVSRQALDALLQKAREFHQAFGRFNLGIDKSALSVDGETFGIDNNIVSALADDLFNLKLELVSLGPNVNARQLGAFLSLLCMDPEEAAEAGGAVEILWRAQTDDITVSERVAKHIYEFQEVSEVFRESLDLVELHRLLFEDSDEDPKRDTLLKDELLNDVERLASFLVHVGGSGTAAEQGEIIAEGALPRLVALARYDTIDDRNYIFRLIAESLLLLQADLRANVAAVMLRTISASATLSRRHILEQLSTEELSNLLVEGLRVREVRSKHLVETVSGLVVDSTRLNELCLGLSKKLQLTEIDRKRLFEKITGSMVGPTADPYREDPKTVPRLAAALADVSDDDLARTRADLTAARGPALRQTATRILAHLIDTESDHERFESLVNGLLSAFERAVSAQDVTHAIALVHVLVNELRQRHDDVPKATVIKKALGVAGRQEIVLVIVNALESDPPLPFSEAEQFLILLGNHGIVTLLALLGGESNAQRRSLICRLLASCSRHNLSSLGSKVLDHRWYLVRNVVSILGQLGDPQAIRYLNHAASHDDPRVRLETVRALANLGSQAFGPLKRLINDEKAVRIEALLALGQTGNPQAAPLLIEAASTRDLLNRNVDERVAAIEGLGHLGDQTALPLLQSLAAGAAGGQSNRLISAARSASARIKKKAGR